jgi:hypothetical protein
MTLLGLIVLERLRNLAVRGQLEQSGEPERLDPQVRREVESRVRSRVAGSRYEPLDSALLSDAELSAVDRLLGGKGDFWDWGIVERAAARLYVSLDAESGAG